VLAARLLQRTNADTLRTEVPRTIVRIFSSRGVPPQRCTPEIDRFLEILRDFAGVSAAPGTAVLSLSYLLTASVPEDIVASPDSPPYQSLSDRPSLKLTFARSLTCLVEIQN
jgi:hypothetical protein